MSPILTLFPAPRLIALAAGVTAGALALLIVPAAVPLLVAVNVVLAGAALLDFLFTPGPRVLRVERRAPECIGLLTRQKIVIQITNQGPLALRLRLRDTAPPELQAPDGTDWSGEVPADGEVEGGYVVRAAVRGQHTWGPLHVRYRSLWGLWERGLIVPGGQSVRVYPGLADIERYHLLARANRLEQLGVRKVKARGQAEFESLRDYTNGDDVRLLDWKATARRSRLTIRQLQTERNQSIILLIDSGRLMNAEEDGVSKLDHAINAALLLAHVGLTRGDKVGLCTFSHRQHAWVPPRSQPGHLQVLTDALYNLRGDFTESDHGRALAAVSARHGKCALLVVLTDFTDAATAQEMVAQVAHAGRRHLVLFAALKDRFLLRASQGLASRNLASRGRKAPEEGPPQPPADKTTLPQASQGQASRGRKAPEEGPPQPPANMTTLPQASQGQASQGQASRGRKAPEVDPLQLPAEVTTGFRQAVALDLLRQRAEVLEALRHHGVQVIDVAPSDLSPAVLNGYLEVTFRGLL